MGQTQHQNVSGFQHSVVLKKPSLIEYMPCHWMNTSNYKVEAACRQKNFEVFKTVEAALVILEVFVH